MLRFSITRQRIVIGAGLFLLAAISWWSADVLELSDDSRYLVAGQPDYFMRELDILVQDPQGLVKHKLSASELAHFPNTENTQFSQPKVEIYRDKQPAWLVEAEHGVLNSTDQQIEFDEGVSLYQGGLAVPSALQLATEALTVDLIKQQAWGDGAVKLWQPGLGEMHGEGMSIDLQSNQLHLQSQVRVRYENN